MNFATTKEGVKLYFEETGSGTPIIFVHEFAGDHRSWEPQMRFFSRYFRCVTYSARGYLPSDVPSDPEAPIRNNMRATMSSPCSIIWKSTKLTSSACRWVDSRRCMWASPIRSARYRW